MNFSGKNLEKNSGKKNFLIHIITRKIPRGVLATRVCLARTPRNKSRNNFEENFDKKIWKKKLEKKFWKKKWKKNFKKILGKKFSHSYNHEKNPAWGARNTRVSRVRNPRNKSRKKFEENIWKKIWKKNLKKILRKNFEENFDKKNLKKNWKKIGKKFWEKILRKIYTKKFWKKKFGKKKFGKKIWQKNSHWYNHVKNPAWGARNTRVSRGVLATRVCLAGETLETNPEKILIITRKIPRGVLATHIFNI